MSSRRRLNEKTLEFKDIDPQLTATLPIPPTSASIENGKLKDTAANRALDPQITPQEVFSSKEIVERAFYTDEKSIVLCDEVKKALEFLIENKIEVDCVITSPPYYGQRDYKVKGQIGLEEHPQQYIDRLVEV